MQCVRGQLKQATLLLCELRHSRLTLGRQILRCIAKTKGEDRMNAVVREIQEFPPRDTAELDRLATLLDAAEQHAAAFRNREGLRAAHEALGLARTRGDWLCAGRALCKATLCHYQRGDFAAAVASGLEAIEAFAERDPVGRSNALQTIALSLFAVDAIDLAETVAQCAVADAREGRDARREASARTVLGSILVQRRHFAEARTHFRAAAAQHRILGETLRMKQAIAHIGDSYREQGVADARAGRLAHAHMLWRQALRVYRIALAKGKSQADDALLLGNIAQCECRMGNLESAYAEAGRGIELANRVASAFVLAPCHLWESHALKGMGELETAEQACERAKLAAEATEDGEMVVACLENLASIQDLSGKFEKANDFEQQARQIAMERESSLMRIRDELRRLWDHYTNLLPIEAARRRRLVNSHA
jgi:tetratricopeptide (TPR) repeat protein